MEPLSTSPGEYRYIVSATEVIKPFDMMLDSQLVNTITRMLKNGPVRVTWKVESILPQKDNGQVGGT